MLSVAESFFYPFTTHSQSNSSRQLVFWMGKLMYQMYKYIFKLLIKLHNLIDFLLLHLITDPSVIFDFYGAVHKTP